MEKIKDYGYFIKENIDIIVLVLFAIFFPVLSVPVFLYRLTYEKNWKLRMFYLTCISVVLGYMAFHTVPAVTDDLSRHFDNMNILRHTKFLKIFQSSYSGVLLNTLIMYLISLTGMNGLYPALYVTIGYFLIFYILLFFQKKFKCSNQNFMFILLFVFFAVNFRDFISGLRNYFAFIICAFLLIQKFYNNLNSKYCYIGIAIASLIHTSALIVLVLVLISDITANWKYRYLVNLSILLFLPISILGYKIFEQILPGIAHTTFFIKVYNYLTTPNIFNINVYLFYIGIVLLSIFCHCRNKPFKNKKNRNFSKFMDLYFVFLLAISPIMLLLMRFNFLLIPLLPCILFASTKRFKHKKYLQYVLILFILAGILMFVASLRAYPWRFNIPHIMFWWLR